MFIYKTDQDIGQRVDRPTKYNKIKMKQNPELYLFVVISSFLLGFLPPTLRTGQVDRESLTK